MKPRVAFIDDELVFSRRYLKEVADHFEVDAIEDAGEALTFVQSRGDLKAIVVDVMMPAPAGVDPNDVNDGLDTGIWLIRQLVPWLKTNPVPVIVLTDRATEPIRTELSSLPLPDGLIVVRSKSDTPSWHLPILLQKAIDTFAGADND